MRFLLLSLLLSSRVFGGESSLQADLRYRTPTFREAVLEQSLVYRAEMGRWVTGRFGARLSQSSWDFHAFQYMAEIASPVCRFFEGALRLSHVNQLRDGTSASTLFSHGRFTFPIARFLVLELGGGWGRRYVRLDRARVVPTLFSGDYSEATWAGKFGLRVTPVSGWDVSIVMANYEEIDLFNLNNPYVGVDLAHTPRHSRFRYRLLARYKMLLGFGRLDEFLVGARLDILISR